MLKYLECLRSPHLTRKQRMIFVELIIWWILVWVFRVYAVVMFSIMLFN
jgi:hypothetical protein